MRRAIGRSQLADLLLVMVDAVDVFNNQQPDEATLRDRVHCILSDQLMVCIAEFSSTSPVLPQHSLDISCIYPVLLQYFTPLHSFSLCDV